jgi:PPOX class probable F420-dependent enzyme
MPKPPLPAEIEAMLQRPNPAIIATVRPDGQPVTVATWYLYENGRILVNMDAARKRLEHLRSDPRISITVLDGDNWYSHISIQGRVAEITDDVRHAGIDRLSRHYGGSDYPDHERPRVDAWVEIDSYHVWDPAAALKSES